MNVPSHPRAGDAARFIRERAEAVGVATVQAAVKKLADAGLGDFKHARVYNFFARRYVPAEGVPLLAIILDLDDVQRLRLFDLIAEDKGRANDDEERLGA